MNSNEQKAKDVFRQLEELVDSSTTIDRLLDLIVYKLSSISSIMTDYTASKDGDTVRVSLKFGRRFFYKTFKAITEKERDSIEDYDRAMGIL